MGLESVELVLSMEDAFGISISDEEAQNIITPKDAIDLISNKVQVGDDGACLNQVAFYRFRKILVNEFNLNRCEVEVESDISKLIAPEKQSEYWARLKEITNINKLPELSRPAWVVYLTWVIFGVVTILSGIEIGAVLGVFCGFIVFSLIMVVTRPMKNLIPSYYKKMDKLIRFSVTTNPGSFKNEEQWSLPQIKQEVKNIVMEVLGTDKYEEDWEFVRDFGIG